MGNTVKETNTASESGVSQHARLVAEITLYEKQAKEWETKGKKIIRRYKDERSPREESVARYNSLWSNIQTLAPALYAKNPKPNIERRFKDNDALSRVTSEVLERCTDYFINSDNFSQCMKQTVLDRLLPGRGTAWERYVPHFKDAEIKGPEEVKNEGPEISDDSIYNKEKPDQIVDYEESVSDYVHWQDFGHNIGARTWEEVYLGWRRAYLDRDELKARFPDSWINIPLDYTPKGLNDEKISTELKKASIYEMWDKNKKVVFWLHREMSELLDQEDDPLRLPDFFPFPRPLHATLANDTLIPVADYREYQDQAIELDELTSRIAAIKKSLKVAGVYDASAEGISRLLSEGTENQLVPIEQWAMLSDKGGVAGVMSLLPMKEIADTLLTLYEAREQTKNDLYEISGMSDIMRGSTDPNETAAAQTIKGQYSNLRLRASQDEVQRFARDMVRIKAQIIAEHFSLETIKQISGMKLLMNMEKQQLLAKIQMMQQPQPMPQGQPGQPPAPPAPPPPIPEEMQEQLDNPTWEEVYALLKNDSLRCFRIDIETDSTIRADQDAEKADRISFLEAAGGFLKNAMEAGQQEPDLIPLLGEMLRFGVEAFKVSKPLEGAFNIAITNMEKKASQAQGQPPKQSPEQQKAQSDIAIQEAKAASDQKEMEAKLQMDEKKMLLDSQLDEKRMVSQEKLEERKLQMEFAFRLKELRAKASMEGGKPSEVEDVDDGGFTMPDKPSLADSLTHLANNVAASNQMHQQNHTELSGHIANLTKAATAPKQLIRDAQGRAIGARTVQ